MRTFTKKSPIHVFRVIDTEDMEIYGQFVNWLVSQGIQYSITPIRNGGRACEHVIEATAASRVDKWLAEHGFIEKPL